MITVRDVTEKLFALAPAALKEDWDNVGLLLGSETQEVKKVLVSLDASLRALEEAKTLGCDLIVTHHPILFGEIREVTDRSAMGKRLLYAAKNGIACVAMHTNLDSVCGGVGQTLAERLRLKNVTCIAPRGADEQGRPYGYLYAGDVPQTTLADFLQTVKTALGCRGLRFASGSGVVRRIAVGGGACGDEIPAVLQNGIDTFVTADLKYHEFCDAAEMGLNLIDAGHFQTENLICEKLCAYLKDAFPTLEIVYSGSHEDVTRFA